MKIREVSVATAKSPIVGPAGGSVRRCARRRGLAHGFISTKFRSSFGPSSVRKLGVELHAVQGPGFVAHAHDLVLGGPGADFEVGIGERRMANHQAVVARRLERVGQAAEDALPVVKDRRRLAVHDPFVPHHLAAEHVADALVAQADAERRHRFGEPPDQLVGDARLARRARTRRDDEVRGLQRGHLVRRDLVVANDAQVDVRVELAQALDEVISKGIVVVDEEDHGYRC